MNNQSKNICIIPVKSFSTRLPSKNFLKLGEKPLWKWTLDSAVASKKFDRIIVSTDSPNRFVGFSLPPNVLIYKRDKLLCMNSVHSSEVVLDVWRNLKPSLALNSTIFMALVTSPFRDPSTFSSVVDTCIEKNKSVVGVVKASKGSNSYRQKDPETGLIKTPQSGSLNRQSTDIDEYIVTGSIFASPLDKFIKFKSFHQPDALFVELNELEALDINSELDFRFARFLLESNFISESC